MDGTPAAGPPAPPFTPEQLNALAVLFPQGQGAAPQPRLPPLPALPRGHLGPGEGAQLGAYAQALFSVGSTAMTPDDSMEQIRTKMNQRMEAFRVRRHVEGPARRVPQKPVWQMPGRSAETLANILDSSARIAAAAADTAEAQAAAARAAAVPPPELAAEPAAAAGDCPVARLQARWRPA